MLTNPHLPTFATLALSFVLSLTLLLISSWLLPSTRAAVLRCRKRRALQRTLTWAEQETARHPYDW